jgi:hypothetical protein
VASITCTGFAFIIASITCELPPQPTAVVCPPVVAWPAAKQQAAAAELRKLPAGHPLREMGVVAIKQRDVVKACKGAAAPAGQPLNIKPR